MTRIPEFLPYRKIRIRRNYLCIPRSKVIHKVFHICG